MDFPFLADFSPFQTWIEILRGDNQNKQPDVRASILRLLSRQVFIDADVKVNQKDQEIGNRNRATRSFDCAQDRWVAPTLMLGHP
jgi:hypothetical protein